METHHLVFPRSLRVQRPQTHLGKFTVAGVIEDELHGGQGDLFGGFAVAARPRRGLRTVERVADDRVSTGRSLQTQLMHPAGDGAELDERPVAGFVIAEWSHVRFRSL